MRKFGNIVAPDSADNRTPYDLHDKNRFGADLQFPYRFPFFGDGKLIAEALQGKDWDTTNNRYAQGRGGYIQLAQTVFPKSQIAVRYEIWDPDTDADSDGINTLGLAFLQQWGENVRLTVAYEMPKNQDPTKENDNLVTVQVQFKF